MAKLCIFRYAPKTYAVARVVAGTPGRLLQIFQSHAEARAYANGIASSEQLTVVENVRG